MYFSSFFYQREEKMSELLEFKRQYGRLLDEMRPVEMITGINKYAEGSCLIKAGDTHVMCTASLEKRVPLWVRGTGSGWVTAEYGMLPRSTSDRMDREAKKGQSGRTQEIQRLIGRSLRSVVDLKQMGEISIKVDCDVIQADGGTRTASISGGFVALYLALNSLKERHIIRQIPIQNFVGAISCGIVKGNLCLDLDYDEDSSADVDSNFVLTSNGRLVEIQGTAEKEPFTPKQFLDLLALAQKGVGEITQKQKEALGL